MEGLWFVCAVSGGGVEAGGAAEGIRSEGSLLELFLSFHHMGSSGYWAWPQVPLIPESSHRPSPCENGVHREGSSISLLFSEGLPMGLWFLEFKRPSYQRREM